MMDRYRSERGQMTVELAVVTPIVLVALVIAWDLFVFIDECARFDNLAAQALLSQAASPERDKTEADACARAAQDVLAASFSREGESVEVACSSSGRLTEYSCTLRMAPWPLGGGSLGAFGLKVPPLLSHSSTLTVDAYVPGKL